MMRRVSTAVAPRGLAGTCVATIALAFGSSGLAVAAARHGESTAASHKEPTIRLKMIGRSYSPVHTDGARWAVYEPTASVTRIMDTKTGHSLTRADPPGCPSGLETTGGGEILYACSDPQCPEARHSCLLSHNLETASFQIEDIVAGTLHTMAGENELTPGEGNAGVGPIGAQWVVVYEPNYHASKFYFLNWHTGRLLPEKQEPNASAADFEDLNSTVLLRPLCKPLTRDTVPPGQIGFTESFVSNMYAPPFMAQAPFKYGVGHLYLTRCGSTQRELVPELHESTRYRKIAGNFEGTQLTSTTLSARSEHLWRLKPDVRPWLGQSYKLIGPATSPKGREPGAIQQITATTAFDTVERLVYRRTEAEGKLVNHGSERYAIWAAKLPWSRAG